MRSVRRYQLAGLHERLELTLPRDAQILGVETLNGVPYLFAFVNELGVGVRTRVFIAAAADFQFAYDTTKDYLYIGMLVGRVVILGPHGYSPPQDTPTFFFEEVDALVHTARLAEQETP